MYILPEILVSPCNLFVHVIGNVVEAETELLCFVSAIITVNFLNQQPR